MTAAENFIHQADMLLESWPAKVRLPTVAVTGPFNAGKSTLINALLENNVAPVDVVPTTMVPVKYVYGVNFSTGSKAVPEPSLLAATLARTRNLRPQELKLPHRLLQKCTLLDTPGFDTSPEHRAAAMDAAARADLVLFLFHQRGLDESSKQFLETLARQGKKNPRDIICALNHNIGHPDDSALGVTATYLRQIFKASLRPYAIDLTNPVAVNSLRTLLEVEAAARQVEEINRNLRTLDEGIPRALKTTLARQSDLEFLADLWDLKGQASSILQARELLQSRAVARNAAHRSLSGPAPSRGSQLKYQPPGQQNSASKGLAQMRQALLDLLDQISTDPSLPGILDPARANSLRRRLERFSFPVTIAGGFSSGKSTFVNAILGEKILPTGDGPTTACLTYVRPQDIKQAILHYPLQLIVPVIHLDGESAGYCREEVKALTDWLMKPEFAHELGHLDLITGTSQKRIKKYQLQDKLQHVARLFAAGLARQPGLTMAPTLFQTIPAKRITGDLPVGVRVTFRGEKKLTFSLETGSGRQAFQHHLEWPRSFRLGRIEITHPSKLLRGLVLVDTPGLDSVHHRHRETTLDFIKGDQSVLFFLNARHVLNAADRDQLPVLSRQIQQGLAGPGKKSPAQLMLVINFADTLTPREREKVRNFVRGGLSPALVRPGEKLHFLSARRAAANPRDNDFRRLTEAIRLAAGPQLAAPLAGVLKELRSVLGQGQPDSRKTTYYLGELGRLERRLAEATTPESPRRF